MSPLRISVALHRVFPHGGLQRDALRTAAECARRGHHVTLHTQRFDGPRPLGMEVRLHDVSGRSNHARALDFARRLQAARTREPCDAQIGFDKLPGLDVYFAGDPCYVARVRRTRGPWARLTPRYRAFEALERAVFGRGGAARILLLDGRERVVFQSIYGTDEQRFGVLFPGVSRDRAWTPERHDEGRRLRVSLGVGADAKLLLFLGSDFRRKGLDRAVRALAALPPELLRDTVLLAAGADDPGPMLRLAARLGVARNVRIEAGRDDVPALLAAADLLVHPAREELGGLVLIEAIAARLPVLCTDRCGFAPYVAAAGAGVVTEAPFSQPALDQALAERLSSPLAPFRESARAYTGAHDLHGMHARIADAVEAAAAARS